MKNLKKSLQPSQQYNGKETGSYEDKLGKKMVSGEDRFSGLMDGIGHP